MIIFCKYGVDIVNSALPQYVDGSTKPFDSWGLLKAEDYGTVVRKVCAYSTTVCLILHRVSCWQTMVPGLWAGDNFAFGQTSASISQSRHAR